MSNLQTNVWGPAQWFVLHLVALTLPENANQKTRITFARRFLSVFETLPCSVCRKNITENLHRLGVGTASKLPTAKELASTPYFESEDTLFYFTFKLHNEINRILHKPVVPDTEYYTVKQRYQMAYAKSSACGAETDGGCTTPESGYQPCMSRIAVVPRSLDARTHGPAFYFDVSLEKEV